MLLQKKLLSRPNSAASLCRIGSTCFSSTGTTPRIKYEKPLKTKQYGIDILHDPLWNKSLAFDLSERDRLGLRGLVPPAVRSLESQVLRIINAIRHLPDDVAKNLYLQELHNRNETLYHRVLLDYVCLQLLISPVIVTDNLHCFC